MKYLDIILDSRLAFKDRFRYIGDKVAKVTRVLWRLMPNLRDPHEKKRRLFENILIFNPDRSNMIHNDRYLRP